MKYILISLFIFLILLSGETWLQKRKIDRLKADNERLSKDVKELLAKDQSNLNLVLTQKEALKVSSLKIDSLAKLLKTRPKTITKIIEKTVTEIVRDTVEVISEYLSGVSWKLSDGGDCWKWQADAELKDLDLEINRNFFSYENKTTDVFWWNRKKILFLKIGKKEYFQKSIPKCGTAVTKSIEIIKK